MIRLIIFVFAISNFAFGSETKLWSDTKGIIENYSCEYTFLKDPKLKIVHSNSQPAQLKALDADFNYEVESGSVVLVENKFKNNSSVKVLTYQGSQNVERQLLGKSGTRGLINSKLLVDISDKLLSLEGETHRVLSDEFEVEHLKLVTSHAKDRGQKIAKCRLASDRPLKEFLIFDIIDAKTLSKISEIGVDIVNSSIMKLTHFDSKVFTSVDSLPKFGTQKFNVFSHVICSENATVPVYNNNHSLLLFDAANGEAVVPFQSFEGLAAKEQQDSFGSKKIYQKVKFLDREENNVGWILRKYIQLTSECPFIEIPTEEEDNTSQDNQSYIFPIVKQPTHPYDSGMRRFGARRSGGSRLHAANDLYRKRHDAVVAVQGGTIIRSLYPFYEGTYAIEVKHDSGKVVRYGEISAKRPPGRILNVGTRVSKKDIVGFIGRLNSGCCNPMLHFELYSGKATGRLSDSSSGTKFKRRWDLLNPTNFLKDWEKTSPWK